MKTENDFLRKELKSQHYGNAAFETAHKAWNQSTVLFRTKPLGVHHGSDRGAARVRAKARPPGDHESNKAFNNRN